MEKLITLNQEILRKIWPLDIGCTCQAMGFNTIAVNLVLIAVIFYLLYKVLASRQDPFFPSLFLGFILFALSEVVDWWQSLLISVNGYLVFNPTIYTVQEVLRIIGLLIIFVTIFKAQKEYNL